MFKLNKRTKTVASVITLVLMSSSVTSQSNGNYCGTSWIDAVSRCAKNCPSGAPSECFNGETCFAGTPCTEVVPETPPPVPAAVPQPTAGINDTGGTCGGGQVGNGICPISTECCSLYGYCGTTSEHCDQTAMVPQTSATQTNFAPSTGGAAPSVYGTCGGGDVGNGICANNNECCSMYGFCGTSEEHCANKVGNFGPNYPAEAQATPQVYVPEATTPQVSVPAASSPATLAETLATPQTVTTQTETASGVNIEGTCGNGDVGNGICVDSEECCSAYGFCGTSLEHCTNKVGSAGPDYPAEQQYTPPAQLPTTPQATIPVATVTPQTVASNQGTNQQTSIQYYEPVPPHGTNKKIIGYYAGWQWYDRDKLADPSNLDFKKVQRVNYAFFQPDAQGNIYGTDRWGDPQLLFGPYSDKLMGGIQKCSYDGPNEVNCAYHENNAGIINLAHAAGAEVYPSIGGWTLRQVELPLSFYTYHLFDVLCFAKNCADIVQYYGFDGIDIDWEYPGYAEHSGTPADAINFTKMLAAIRAALDMLTMTTGKKYGLTAALPCNPQHIGNIEVTNLVNILTEYNLMSYDFFGAFDNVTGVNAPLYPQGFGNDDFCIDRCVTNYMNLGVPKEKLNVGLPFYGRSFKYATGLNQPHGGNDVASWPDDDGSPQYFNIYSKLPNMIQVRDNKSKTQYAYTSRLEQPGLQLPEGLVSFDDERSICDKVNYVQKHELGGFIIWELSGDLLDDLRTPLLDITNKKLANPAFECCKLHSEHECELEKAEEEKQNTSLSLSQGGFDGYKWVEQNNSHKSNAKAPRPAFILLFVLPYINLVQLLLMN
eukprot:CCRYP_005442-RB/>CCRYP_005442-RB protein AED:0.09 eAED:0.09 QI:133/0.93/0.88/1/0.87/0.82/17/1617/824